MRQRQIGSEASSEAAQLWHAAIMCLGEPAIELDHVATMDQPRKVPGHATVDGDRGLDPAQRLDEPLVIAVLALAFAALVPAFIAKQVSMQRRIQEAGSFKVLWTPRRA